MKNLVSHVIVPCCFLFCTLAGLGQPVISNFSPKAGPVSSTVTITGSGFNAVAANNIVRFGSVKATVTAASASSLTVTVPAGATFQAINVLNMANKLIGSAAFPFTPTFSGCAPLYTGTLLAKSDFTAGTVTRSVVFADLDGDGKADMIATNTGTNNISVFRNTSTTAAVSFAAKTDFACGGAAASGVATGDIDGDGKLDIAVSNYNSASVSVFINTSTSPVISFAAPVDFPTPANPLGVIIADMDGDGKSDMATANFLAATASVSLFLNTSVPGTVSFSIQSPNMGLTAPRELAFGDIDGDGKSDLVVSDEGGAKVAAYRNTSVTGAISFAAPVTSATGTAPRAVALGDLDGDGKLDIALVNSGSASLSVFRNTSVSGTISLAAKADYSTGTSPRELALGDLDGDGRLDIAASNNTSATVSVFHNTSSSGTISFATKVDFTAGANALGTSIQDINNDGKLDLAVTSSSGGTVGVYANLSPVSTLASLSAANASTSSVCDNSTWKTLYDVGTNSVLAAVKDNGNNLGTLSATVYVDASPGTVTNGQRYLQRHYVITPVTQPGSSVQVRLYFTNAELLALEAVDNAVLSASDLSVTKYSGPNEDGVYTPTGGTRILIPRTAITTGTAYGGLYLEFTVSGFSEFWIHSGLSLLPVNLSDFTTTRKTNGVLLKWTTASEENADRFIVERSADGQNYTALGSVPATGNSTAPRFYSFSDINPSNGNNYYRLQQVDLDGRKNESKVLMMNWSLSNRISVSLAYQSAKQLSAAINGKIDNGTFTIYDGSGREVKRYKINTGEGGSVLNIDLHAYSSGIYLYQLATETGAVINGKIVLK